MMSSFCLHAWKHGSKVKQMKLENGRNNDKHFQDRKFVEGSYALFSSKCHIEKKYDKSGCLLGIIATYDMLRPNLSNDIGIQLHDHKNKAMRVKAQIRDVVEKMINTADREEHDALDLELVALNEQIFAINKEIAECEKFFNEGSTYQVSVRLPIGKAITLTNRETYLFIAYDTEPSFEYIRSQIAEEA
jgi:hypothetical protein